MCARASDGEAISIRNGKFMYNLRMRESEMGGTDFHGFACNLFSCCRRLSSALKWFNGSSITGLQPNQIFRQKFISNYLQLYSEPSETIF